MDEREWAQSRQDLAEGFKKCRGIIGALGDETRQHEGNEFVPCRTDGEIYEEAVRNWHASHPEA